MSKNQGFVVTLWLKLNERADDLMKEIARSEPFVPSESTDYEGMRDFHWVFAERIEAESYLSLLKNLAEAPEVVVLRLTNYDDVQITLKDTRRVAH